MGKQMTETGLGAGACRVREATATRGEKAG